MSVNLSTKRIIAIPAIIGKAGLFSPIFFSGILQIPKKISMKNALILQRIQLQPLAKKMEK